ncbi:MAG: P-loop NTPase [Desulfosudaceae bacterium]
MAIIYPVAGGKGGIGKSFITANLGYLLAKRGKRVLLADLDLGGSNLHTLLGLKDAPLGLNDFLNKSRPDLADVIVDSSVPNLSLLTSKNCSMEAANLHPAQKQKIITAIRRLDYDYILLDLGAGTNFNTLDFFLVSRKTLLVFTPEPTSIEIGIRFIKAAYYRRLKQIIRQHSLTTILREEKERSSLTSRDIIDQIIRHEPEKEALLRQSLRELTFKFIVNQTRPQKMMPVGETIQRLCDRHFYSNFEFLGDVAYDDRVYYSIISKQIYTRKFPYTRASRDLMNIIEKI